MHVITLPEAITGVILGVQFVSGVGRTNSPMTAGFFEKYKGAKLSTPESVHKNVADSFRALLAKREDEE